MVFEKIRSILADQFSEEEDSITMTTDLAEDLGADSLDLVEIITAMEEEYEIRIPDKDLEGMTTVGDLVNYLQRVTGKE